MTSRPVVVGACALSLSPFGTQLLASREHPVLPIDGPPSINPFGVSAGTALIAHLSVREGLPPTPRPPASEAIEVAVRRYMGGAASIQRALDSSSCSVSTESQAQCRAGRGRHQPHRRQSWERPAYDRGPQRGRPRRRASRGRGHGSARRRQFGQALVGPRWARHFRSSAARVAACRSVRPTRSLDGIARDVPETFYLSLAVVIPRPGEAPLDCPVGVRVVAQGGEGEATADYPLRIAHARWTSA